MKVQDTGYGVRFGKQGLDEELGVGVNTRKKVGDEGTESQGEEGGEEQNVSV